MAKVTLRSDIQSISGRVGNILFKTYTKTDGTKETRAYSIPYRGNGRYYQRSTKPSAGEIAARKQFQNICMAIKALTKEQRQNYCREWVKAKYTLNGKKYASLRGYIMARMYQDLKKSKA